MPDIITDARAAICGAMAADRTDPAFGRNRGRCALIKSFAQFIDRGFMRSYVVHMVCAKLESSQEITNGILWLRPRQH
jgi:hypothetical protein